MAIISKVAALYVQDFPDASAVAAVDQIETLCSGLSQKIWQKIMVLDRIADEPTPSLAVASPETRQEPEQPTVA